MVISHHKNYRYNRQQDGFDLGNEKITIRILTHKTANQNKNKQNKESSPHLLQQCL